LINVAAALQQIEGLLRAGKAADAARQCKQLRKSRVEGPGLLKLEGIAAFMLGKHAEAATALARYAEVAPNDTGTLAILGHAQLASGKPDRAALAFRRVAELEPGLAASHTNLGKALLGADDFAAALESFRRALALHPINPEALAGEAQTLAAQGLDEAAAEAYGRAIAQNPQSAELHTNLGSVFQILGRFREAAESHRRAIALNPDLAEAFTNLGNALQELGDLDEAVASHRRAVALAPRQARCHHNLGAALLTVGCLREAAECCEKALSLHSDAKAFRNLVAGALYRDDLGDEALKNIRRRFGRAHAMRVEPLPPPPPGDALRIGYLSSDFHSHPVTGNLLPVLHRMDRDRFPIHVYAQGKRADTVTDELRALAAGWTDITRMSDAEAAQRIRDDGIHILVSLAGHFDENRPTVCAHRAAPVQISLHDVATSGLSEMDYIIGDPILLPRRSPEHFTERPLRLPHFYVAEPPDGLPPLRPRKAGGGPVFCCFNNPTKIGPATLAAWGRILAQVPDGRLALKYLNRYACSEISERVLKLLVQSGARPEQVEMQSGAEPLATFLDRYNDVDMALDPFPFSGSTTSFQALAMGVPVLTWPWKRMVGRWTASLLKPLGLDEFIATSAEDYIARAVAIRTNEPDMRAELRARLASSPLCDGARWARNLERLYGAVWRRYLSRVSAI